MSSAPNKSPFRHQNNILRVFSQKHWRKPLHVLELRVKVCGHEDLEALLQPENWNCGQFFERITALFRIIYIIISLVDTAFFYFVLVLINWRLLSLAFTNTYRASPPEKVLCLFFLKFPCMIHFYDPNLSCHIFFK
jgi:hypothetical protein